MQISPLIVGTMRWGIWGANHSEKQVQHLIETALSQGLTTFDHADIYGDYTGERLFGNTLQHCSVARDSVQLITKCGIEMPCANRDFKIKSYNYSAEHLLKSVEISLRNLRTDYIDLLLLHRPSPLMNPQEIASTFDKLKKEGKVKHFGVSNFSPSQFELLDSEFPLVTNQIEVSVNETKAFYNGTLDQLMLKKLRPMAWSVMGNYFSENSEQNLRIKKVLNELAPKYDATENQLLLAFILKHPARILPVIGTSNAETLVTLANGLRAELSREDWFKLLEASRGTAVE